MPKRSSYGFSQKSKTAAAFFGFLGFIGAPIVLGRRFYNIWFDRIGYGERSTALKIIGGVIIALVSPLFYIPPICIYAGYKAGDFGYENGFRGTSSFILKSLIPSFIREWVDERKDRKQALAQAAERQKYKSIEQIIEYRIQKVQNYFDDVIGLILNGSSGKDTKDERIRKLKPDLLSLDQQLNDLNENDELVKQICTRKSIDYQKVETLKTQLKLLKEIVCLELIVIDLPKFTSSGLTSEELEAVNTKFNDAKNIILNLLKQTEIKLPEELLARINSHIYYFIHTFQANEQHTEALSFINDLQQIEGFKPSMPKRVSTVQSMESDTDSKSETVKLDPKSEKGKLELHGKYSQAMSILHDQNKETEERSEVAGPLLKECQKNNEVFPEFIQEDVENALEILKAPVSKEAETEKAEDAVSTLNMSKSEETETKAETETEIKTDKMTVLSPQKQNTFLSFIGRIISPLGRYLERRKAEKIKTITAIISDLETAINDYEDNVFKQETILEKINICLDLYPDVEKLAADGKLSKKDYDNFISLANQLFAINRFLQLKPVTAQLYRDISNNSVFQEKEKLTLSGRVQGTYTQLTQLYQATKEDSALQKQVEAEKSKLETKGHEYLPSTVPAPMPASSSKDEVDEVHSDKQDKHDRIQKMYEYALEYLLKHALNTKDETEFNSYLESARVQFEAVKKYYEQPSQNSYAKLLIKDINGYLDLINFIKKSEEDLSTKQNIIMAPETFNDIKLEFNNCLSLGTEELTSIKERIEEISMLIKVIPYYKSLYEKLQDLSDQIDHVLYIRERGTVSSSRIINYEGSSTNMASYWKGKTEPTGNNDLPMQENKKSRWEEFKEFWDVNFNH